MYTKKGSSSAAFGVLTVDALQFGMHNTQCTISSAHLHSVQNYTVCRIAQCAELHISLNRNFWPTPCTRMHATSLTLNISNVSDYFNT